MRILALTIWVAACSSDPSNAAGDYAVMVTNADNGCNFMNWTAGAITNATVTVTQNASVVTANVTGLGAIVLDLVLGGHAYSGKISGSTLDLDLFGVRSNTTGNCTFTYNSEIRAVLDGDALTGQINYVAATNGNSDCGGIMGCRSFQDFTGTRPAR
jgi:hypothetical protein